jgi:hypothetical protein
MSFKNKINQMTLDEQERWLVEELQKQYVIQDKIKRLLATVRGGAKIKIKE